MLRQKLTYDFGDVGQVSHRLEQFQLIVQNL